MKVCVSIGNSDDKLSQLEWSRFIESMRELLDDQAIQIHGEWFSAPDVEWQNANWMIEFEDQWLPNLRRNVIDIRRIYHQDSAAWSEIENTEFI